MQNSLLNAFLKKITSQAMYWGAQLSCAQTLLGDVSVG